MVKFNIACLILKTTVFFTLIFGFSAISQNKKNSGLSGSIIYTFEKNLGKLAYEEWELYFDNDKSLYLKNGKTKFDDQSFSGMSQEGSVNQSNITTINLDLDINFHYLFDKKKDSIFSQQVVFKTPYYVKKKVNIDWELSDEKKMIGNFKCQKAIGEFRGRTYIVWFTNEIPLPYGPWKLNGLPGLIIEAEDQEKQLSFKATSIKINSNNNHDIDLILKNIKKKGIETPLRIYVKEKENELQKIDAYINSKLDRNFKDSNIQKADKKYSMEKTYEWEE